jgi:hypothetical protein
VTAFGVSTIPKAYLAAWLGALLLAVLVAIRNRAAIRLFRSDYRRFLKARWRLVTFTLGASALTLAAPYAGDPTWDHADALLMAALTYATAPWSVACLYRALRGRERNLAEIYLAGCAWMLSASWSYDLYILLRDGHYPPTWLANANMGASSVLYLSAGLLWNLDWRPGRGVTFSFLEDQWPPPSSGDRFSKVGLYASAFMTMVALTMGYVFLLSR